MLNASEQRELRRAKAQVMAGDRAGALASLRRLEAAATSRRRDVFGITGQLVLAFMVFRCERLDGEEVAVHTCCARQAATDVQRTHQASRGQGSTYPSCDSRTCERGRAIRQAVDPEGRITWRGAGAGWLSRFERGRAGLGKAQDAARKRLEREGLLARVPSVDEPPDEVER